MQAFRHITCKASVLTAWRDFVPHLHGAKYSFTCNGVLRVPHIRVHLLVSVRTDFTCHTILTIFTRSVITTVSSIAGRYNGCTTGVFLVITKPHSFRLTELNHGCSRPSSRLGSQPCANPTTHGNGGSEKRHDHPAIPRISKETSRRSRRKGGFVGARVRSKEAGGSKTEPHENATRSPSTRSGTRTATRTTRPDTTSRTWRAATTTWSGTSTGSARSATTASPTDSNQQPATSQARGSGCCQILAEPELEVQNVYLRGSEKGDV